MKLLKYNLNNRKVYSWGTHRRINLASNYLGNRFGMRVQKLAIDAGFTCPNRDGTKGTGGCYFCNNQAFNPTYCSPEKPIAQQLEEGILFHANRYRRAHKYLAYFQAYSNTYASVERLKQLYSQALNYEGVIGLVVGTRPDCIDEPKLEYFARLAEKYYVVIEYGIESVNNETLEKINRKHTFDDSLHALELTQKYGIYSGAHFIFGLPGDTRDDLLNSADIISALPLHTVKFHQLQIVRGTQFASDYELNPAKFDLFSMDDYIDFVSEFLARLNPALIVERVASETQPRNHLLECPRLRYDQVLRRIEEKMEALDYWQGKNYSPCKKNIDCHDHN